MGKKSKIKLDLFLEVAKWYSQFSSESVMLFQARVYYSCLCPFESINIFICSSLLHFKWGSLSVVIISIHCNDLIPLSKMWGVEA